MRAGHHARELPTTRRAGSDDLPVAADAASPLRLGMKLDRYELLCSIARGGMADVWVARQSGKRGFEKLVAIKSILPRFAHLAGFEEMLLEEARIASSIEHPNVARILDLGEDQGVLFLVMEYVDGDALWQLNYACRQKGLTIPVGLVLRILADTCAGLHEAHELTSGAGEPLAIVHRDVNPQNILLSTKGVAKLIDFGIATAKGRADEVTDPSVVKGKLSYMAPEQVLGGPVDRRADIWAVGMTMYQLLWGRPPFKGGEESPAEPIRQSGKLTAQRPLEVATHRSIAAVARKAVAREARQRFATALEMREAIEGALYDAKLTTTTADVASFTVKHLGERMERRRRAIEDAIAFQSTHRLEGNGLAASRTTRRRIRRIETKTHHRTLKVVALAMTVAVAIGIGLVRLPAKERRSLAVAIDTVPVPAPTAHVPSSLSPALSRADTAPVAPALAVSALPRVGSVADYPRGRRPVPSPSTPAASAKPDPTRTKVLPIDDGF